MRLPAREEVDHGAGRPYGWPVADVDLRTWVDTIAGRLGQINSTIAVILHGSLAMGSFFRPKSDVDLLVVVEQTLPEETRRELAVDLLDMFDRRPIVGGVEISVVQRCFVEPFTYPTPYEFHFSEQSAEEVRGGGSGPRATDRDLAAHCTMARLRGVALLGPSPASVLGEVPHDMYLDAVMDDARSIIEGGIIESPFYGVLNLCRVLQLVLGNPSLPPSKEEGATWAIETLPVEHRRIVAEALEGYRSRAQVPAHLRRVHGHRWHTEPLLELATHARTKLQPHL